jgi:hypothetical protein
MRMIVMRLADMQVVHPRQDNNRVCAVCGHKVGIYPSGQKVLRADPATEIICQVCYKPARDAVMIPAPGALDETTESVAAPDAP